MNFEKRDTQADSAVPEDATEVLPAQAYPQQAGRVDDDATVLLPAGSYRSTNYSSGADPDATTVLPAPSASSLSNPAQTTRFTLPQSGDTSDPDATTVLPATQNPAQGTETAAQRAERLRAKFQENTAAGTAAARSGFANLSARTRETADRIKRERTARKEEKARATAPQTVPVAPAQPQRPYQHAGAFSPQGQAPNQLIFGGRMSNQQASPRPYGSQGLAPTSGENSPSGRLQMLTPSHIRQTRPSLWTLIQHFFAGSTMMFLLIIAVLFFITTSTGQQLDETSFQEFSYQFMLYTQQTSSLLDLIPAAAGVIAAVGILFVLIWKHRFVPALVGLGMAIGANVTTQLLKNYFIIKPNLGIQEATVNSAPSGHTTFAAAAGLALFLASPKRFRPTVALFSMFFTVAAGYSTVVNGWHRPSDVVAAILVTGLWAVLGLVILRFMRSEELDMSDTQRSGLILVPLLSITGFFVGFCAVALYCVTWFNPIPGSSFVAAICLIAAVAALTTSMQIALLRPQNKQRSAYRKVWAY